MEIYAIMHSTKKNTLFVMKKYASYLLKYTELQCEM